MRWPVVVSVMQSVLSAETVYMVGEKSDHWRSRMGAFARFERRP
jgi:hypothetical protein